MNGTNEETALYYRGYYIGARPSVEGKSPTWASGPWNVWVVFQTGEAGAYEEFGVVNTEKAARHLVDELTDKR